MKFTVLGGTGFLGQRLVRHLRALGHDVEAPARTELIGPGTGAGHVIYAIGLTGDFRSRLFETIDAHVGLLTHFLQTLTFDSWLYLSSTRVYGGLSPDAVASETTPLQVMPNADSTYDLSKLLGEAICLAQPQKTVRVARLSNVFGVGQSESTFLASLLRQARTGAEVTIREAPQSSKDYVDVDAVTPLLVRLALDGRERLYNVASGRSTTHEQLAEAIRRATGVDVSFAANTVRRQFPRVDVDRIHREFGFVSSDVLDYVATQVSSPKSELG